MGNNRYGHTYEQSEDFIRERQEYLWEQYEEYIADSPMTAYERRLLRKWVSDGHSVNESPGSKYLPDRNPPTDFLETYREDREIARETKGMTAEEEMAYLKEYIGWEEPDPEQQAYIDVRRAGSVSLKNYIKSVQREMWHLWEFIWQEGLGEEARAFVEDHRDEEAAFEWWMPANN
ncbi:MAG: hypothetical protein J6D57_13180 [Mogibacterium sp.]|nr:hypothetical protein [Mogibacterium sp.]